MRVCIVCLDKCARRRLDARRVAEYFIRNGWTITNAPRRSDYLMYFTCAFTKDAIDNCYKNIDELSKNPGKLIVLGCLPGIRPREGFLKKLEEIDDLFPNMIVKISDVPDANTPYPLLSDLPTGFSALVMKIKSTMSASSKQTAKLRIVNGCLGECTYCAIRFATGKLRSKPLKTCIEEYSMLLSNGHRIFEFEGEDVGAYGSDMKSSLALLFDCLSEKDEGLDVSWRINTLNPEWAMKYRKNILKHIRKITHIKCDIQSGTARIIKLMKRYHNLKDIDELFSEFRSGNPDIHLTSCIIIGFPTETDEEFQKSLPIIRGFGLSELRVIKYSEPYGVASCAFHPKVNDEKMSRRLRYIKEYFSEYSASKSERVDLYLRKPTA